MTATLRIFVAGASGTIGIPLVRALIGAGHQVTALTRTPEKQGALAALGAVPVLADALDAEALREVVIEAAPTHVIHQLTALPKDGPRRSRDLHATNRLRIDGTRNLLDAASAAGARRVIGGSFALLQRIGDDTPATARDAAAAVASMESQIAEASGSGRIDGIVLRYGLFYGAENPATRTMLRLVRRRMLPVVRGDRSLLPWIHLEDAVSATLAALDRGVPGTGYDIVDDRPISLTEMVRALAAHAGAPPPFAVPPWVPRLIAPYLSGVTAMRVTTSNQRARADLGWRPRFATVHDGLGQTVALAA